MPIPFHNTNRVGHPDTIAWLRLVEAQDGWDARAALFETSAQGEPLGFSVACMAASARAVALPNAAEQSAASSLTGVLLRASTATPTLLFGLAEEIPAEAFDDQNTAVPSCRVCLPTPAAAMRGGQPDDRRRQMLWSDDPPSPASAAGAVFDEIMRWDDPFEPLERAAKGLAEAFDDPRVRALTDVPGLGTLITLLPRAETAGRRAARGTAPATRGSAAARGLAPRSTNTMERGLVARLWTVLASPRTVASQGPTNTRPAWPNDLMPFQRDGVRALIEMDRLLLSDDMGLGKTVQAVAALRILRMRGEIGPCLVVAPASVLDQWRREIARWAPELSAIIIRGPADDRAWQWKGEKDIMLASYDVLRSDAGGLATPRAPRQAWDVVVLDEAQRIKNRNDTSEAAKSIPRVRSWALTGTPIENHEEELASIMEFVDHDEGTPRKRYRPGAALQLRHGELQLRRKKGDVLNELPPKLETKLLIPLHRQQRESYEKAEREGIIYLKSLGAEVGIGHVLELITRLKQICNADPRTGASNKLDDIRNKLRILTAQGHKALVFSQYTGDTSGVAAAANHLREFDPLTLTGEVPLEQRSAVIDRFKTGTLHKALIVSLRVGGLGLNLQEASYVFHLDRWWNPAVERQAEDRTHRLGQTVKVNVIKYTCKDTIEERIDRILERKQALFDRLVDDVSMDLSARMSREELLGLFALDEPA